MLLREERYQVESLEEELQALTAVTTLKDQVAESISQQLSEQEAQVAYLQETLEEIGQENQMLRQENAALIALQHQLANDVNAHRETQIGHIIFSQENIISDLREQIRLNDESERMAWGKATAELEAVTEDCRSAWAGNTSRKFLPVFSV